MSAERLPRWLARPDWRRVSYGDWSWIVRDPLDVLRLAFVAGTIAFASMGRSTAVGLTAASALLLVCRMIDLPRRFDFAVIAAMTLIAWGTALGLYGDYYFYDNLVHGVAPFFYAPVLYIVLVRLEVLVDPERTSIARHHLGVFISTLALGMAVGAGYEVIEWLSDSLLGTHFVKSIDDTGSDLLEDTLGSCAGAALVAVWSLRSWSTRRTTAASRGPSRLSGGELVRNGREVVGAWRLRPVFHWTARLRGLPLALSGLTALAAGAAMLLWREPALRTVEVLFALAMLAQAALDLPAAVRGFRSLRRPNGLATALAEALLAVGLIASPGISRLGLAYLVGTAAVALSLLEAASLSTRSGGERARWLAGLGAVSAFVFGVAILALPDHSLDATVVVFALYLMSLGAVRLVRALESRLALRESVLERDQRQVDDQWEMVGAAARPEAAAAHGDAVADQAVVERDAQQRTPRRPAVGRP
jgi:uncharacterized membrane protein YjdF/uncharacterized membrane protein HdeD (DUF308 family)